MPPKSEKASRPTQPVEVRTGYYRSSQMEELRSVVARGVGRLPDADRKYQAVLAVLKSGTVENVDENALLAQLTELQGQATSMDFSVEDISPDGKTVRYNNFYVEMKLTGLSADLLSTWERTIPIQTYAAMQLGRLRDVLAYSLGFPPSVNRKP